MLQASRRLVLALALGLPMWAQAQVLGFDNVCATPPCAANTLYAATGVTLSTGSVVAAGTGGLTGTNGGSFVYINTFPYQVTITLNRPATYFGFDLSRASGSSGPLSVQVTALLAGAPVFNQTIALTTVNTWTRASGSVAGGFDAIFIDPSGGANNSFGLDNVQFAGNCYGFQDVTTADGFCNATEFLGNRGITTGCALGSYCPNDPVTRAQMALFMNRLANVVSPSILSGVEYGINFNQDTALDTSTGAITPGRVKCKVTIPPAAYPRRLMLAGVTTFLPKNAEGVRLHPVRSTDGGGTYSVFPSNVFNDVNVFAAQNVSISHASTLSIPAGQSTQVGWWLKHVSGTNSGLAYGECEMAVTVVSTTLGSAPFDEPPMKAK